MALQSASCQRPVDQPEGNPYLHHAFTFLDEFSKTLTRTSMATATLVYLLTRPALEQRRGAPSSMNTMLSVLCRVWTICMPLLRRANHPASTKSLVPRCNRVASADFYRHYRIFHLCSDLALQSTSRPLISTKLNQRREICANWAKKVDIPGVNCYGLHTTARVSHRARHQPVPSSNATTSQTFLYRAWSLDGRGRHVDIPLLDT